MKKTLCVLLGALISLCLISSVMAGSQSFNIKLAQKNPSDWSVVKKAGTGNVLLSQGDRAKAIIKGMKPNTEYTLIYYGSGENNDVWPHATCISSKTLTNKRGAASIKTNNFDYAGFIKDGKNQKFWIIKSSDVDCTNHQMIAWNPTEYLFEQKTI